MIVALHGEGKLSLEDIARLVSSSLAMVTKYAAIYDGAHGPPSDFYGRAMDKVAFSQLAGCLRSVAVTQGRQR